MSWELGSFLAQDMQLLAVQQLLIKGLFKPETELSTIQVRYPCPIAAVCPPLDVSRYCAADMHSCLIVSRTDGHMC